LVVNKRGMFILAKGNVFLIGFMGSGKTTVGRCLARALGWDFFDTDEIIVRKLGMSINEIFAQKGEGYFRDVETEVVRCLGERDPGTCVVATGGGVVLREKNWAALSKNGLTIFLDVAAEEIYRRLKDKGDRPLLNVADPLQQIERMLRERRPYYLKADIRIRAGANLPGDLAKEIRNILLERC
jgi:shikimate kinase